MAFDELRNSIKSNINSNGKGEITGDKMQGSLLDIVDEMEAVADSAAQKEEEGGYEYAAVDGLIDKDGMYWFLPGVKDNDPAHTFAMVGDINAVREDLANDKKDLKDYTDQAIATAIEDAITRQLNTLI